MQGYTYGAHISHSGAQQDPAKKGLAGLRASGISARTTPNFGLWKKRPRSGCCTRRLCNTFFDILRTATAGSEP